MMKRNTVILSLLTLSLCGCGAAYADALPQEQAASGVISVYLDGKLLHTEVPPLNEGGTVLVPMRGLFEAQGASLGWNNTDKTVTVTKEDTTLTYQMGAPAADLNGQSIDVAVPGQLTGGSAMIPLRFVSEALGNTVEWVPSTQSVEITSAVIYETSILRGVTLRSQPDAESKPVTADLLSAGTKVHVVSVADALWLKVKTEDNQTGYISAKPKFTDYTSASLADKQAKALIAYGKTFYGTPYEFGASPDQTGTFDCSSFVKRVFGDILSIELPRVSYDQAKEGKEVGLDELLPGDLLFFSARGLDIGHVAIYAGNNQLLHTYSAKLGVHMEAFDGQWKDRFVTARRIL
ncbi:C40 family peptidase [Paenibacillus tianjinensis]|uniref:C40 family peptidase n=1 Tax=Paenibacillus tianjinensis TaxID=2810347 RepID=A0ABX7LAG1_9BACL|nr:stalk domain-containing protein [Paenibacillus tianjinensis]QSF44977.1 C40 family peptidase [Paenibacillus tianjinensis]